MGTIISRRTLGAIESQRRHRHDLARHADDGQRLSDEVFGWILEDDEFFRRFQQPAGEQNAGTT
jgi:hypothetical protein